MADTTPGYWDFSAFFQSDTPKKISARYLEMRSYCEVCRIDYFDTSPTDDCNHVFIDPPAIIFSPVSYYTGTYACDFFNSFNLDQIDLDFIVNLRDRIIKCRPPHLIKDLNPSSISDEDKIYLKDLFDNFLHNFYQLIDNYYDIEFKIDLNPDDPSVFYYYDETNTKIYYKPEINVSHLWYHFPKDLLDILTELSRILSLPNFYFALSACTVCGKHPPLHYNPYVMTKIHFDKLTEQTPGDYIFIRHCHNIIFYQNRETKMYLLNRSYGSPSSFMSPEGSFPHFLFEGNGISRYRKDMGHRFPMGLYAHIIGVLEIDEDNPMYSDLLDTPEIVDLFPRHNREYIYENFPDLSAIIYDDSNRFLQYTELSELVPPDFSYHTDINDYYHSDKHRVLTWKKVQVCYPMEFCIFCYYPIVNFEGTVCPHCKYDFKHIQQEFIRGYQNTGANFPSF